MHKQIKLVSNTCFGNFGVCLVSQPEGHESFCFKVIKSSLTATIHPSQRGFWNRKSFPLSLCIYNRRHRSHPEKKTELWEKADALFFSSFLSNSSTSVTSTHLLKDSEQSCPPPQCSTQAQSCESLQKLPWLNRLNLLYLTCDPDFLLRYFSSGSSAKQSGGSGYRSSRGSCMRSLAMLKLHKMRICGNGNAAWNHVDVESLTGAWSTHP